MGSSAAIFGLLALCLGLVRRPTAPDCAGLPCRGHDAKLVDVDGPNEASLSQTPETTDFGWCEGAPPTAVRVSKLQVIMRNVEDIYRCRYRLDAWKFGRVLSTVMMICFGNRDICIYIYIYKYIYIYTIYIYTIYIYIYYIYTIYILYIYIYTIYILYIYIYMYVIYIIYMYVIYSVYIYTYIHKYVNVHIYIYIYVYILSIYIYIYTFWS